MKTNFFEKNAMAVAFSLAALSAGAQAQIEEITVTAQFREEGSADIPLSITAYDTDRMNKFRMENTRDIAAQTPNVHISYTTFGITSPRISMRGITNADFGPTNSAPVTVYSDGVVIGNSTTQGFAMFDLGRVEILRGPQGTLYGRNATTGSMNFISARPTEELSGFARFTAARFNRTRFDGAISGALSDTVNGRLAITTGTEDGWVTNTIDGDDSPESKDSAVRGILDFAPNDDVSVFLKAQYGRSDAISPPHHNILPANAVSGEPNVGPETNFRNITMDLLHRPVDVESADLTLQVDWQLDGMVFTSLTGYQEHDRIYWNDADQSGIVVLHEVWEHEQDQFSQEFRLTSDTDGALSWIAGLYYLEDSFDGGTVFEITDLVGLGIPGGAPEGVGFGVHWRPKQDITSYAAFFDVDYSFNEQWSVGAGLRYTEDETDVEYFGVTCTTFARESNYSMSSLLDGAPPAESSWCGSGGSTNDSDSWEEVTGNLSLQYRPNDRTMLYANVGKGYKAGAFNLNTPVFTDVLSVNPELLYSYEVGLKWESESRDVVLSSALFYYDYEDFHQFSLVTVGNLLANQLANVPEAEVTGAEFELMWAPSDRAVINLGFSWSDTEFTDFTQADGVSFNGNDFQHAPELMFNGLVQYEFPINAEWSLIPQLDWNWRDDYFGDKENTEEIVVENVAYNLVAEANWDVNARLTLQNNSSGVVITAFVEDIGEEDGDVLTEDNGVDSFGTTWTKVERPTTYGVTLTYTF